MGKALIIKGADFSTNSIGTIEELYEDITDTLINGFVSIAAQTPGPAKLYNASYNNSSSIIPNYLILMNSSTSLYLTNDKGVEWFIPADLRARCWAYKTTSTIGSDGTIADSYLVPSGSAVYIDGNNQWVKASDIYANLEVSASTYPCYMLTISRLHGVTPADLSLAQAKALGLKVRKLKDA